MKAEEKLDRRGFLVATTALVATAPMLTLARAEEKINPDEGVTAPEDLMKEQTRVQLVVERRNKKL